MEYNLEIYFDNKYFFPYKYLDFATSGLSEYNNFALYFIMSSSKLKITKAIFFDNMLITTYCNNSGKEITIKNTMFRFSIPDEYVSIDIHKSGDRIVFKVSKEAHDYLISFGINEEYVDALILDGMKLDIYALIMRTYDVNAVLDEFSLLYIGQSRNVVKRLESHKTIQKIERDCDLEYNDLDIFVMVLHPKAKRIDHFDLSELSLQGLVGISSTNDGGDLIEGVDSNEVLDAAEIILIQTFRPKYNTMHKKANPNKKQKKYNCFYDAGVKNVTLSLDLNFDCDVIHLSTKEFSTQGKPGWMFECPLDELSSNEEIHIMKTPIGFDIY